jgi:hypothetical protein
MKIDLLYKRLLERQKQMVQSGQVPKGFFDRPLEADEVDVASLLVARIGPETPSEQPVSPKPQTD